VRNTGNYYNFTFRTSGGITVKTSKTSVKVQRIFETVYVPHSKWNRRARMYTNIRDDIAGILKLPKLSRK